MYLLPLSRHTNALCQEIPKMHRHVFTIDIFGEGYLATPAIDGMNFIMLDLIGTLPRGYRSNNYS